MSAEVEIPICQDCSFPLGGVHFQTLEIQGNSLYYFAYRQMNHTWMPEKFLLIAYGT